MPSSPRRDLIRDGEIATYHVWSRTAQQRYLLGFDKDTGENHERRRAWLVKLLAHQAKFFAVDVANFHPMGNHFHLMVRTRPDIVQKWSDDEVAWRWRMAWPKFDEGRLEWYRRPTDAQVRKLLSQPEKLMQVRKNLSSLSWFVARLKEPFAKVCNADANTEGHFWAERFGSRELVDDAAILACSMYIDVNQVKAGVAPSLSQSMYSTIQARIIENRMSEAEEAMETFREQDGERLGISSEELTNMYLNCSWIAPIQPNGALKLVNDAWQAYVSPGQLGDNFPVLGQTRPDMERLDDDLPTADSLTPDEVNQQPEAFSSESEAASGTNTSAEAEKIESATEDASVRSAEPSGHEEKAQVQIPGSQPTYEIHCRLIFRTPPRASDTPFLDMTLAQYIQLAEAAADRVRKAREAPMPESLANILRGCGIVSESWDESLVAFHEIFCHVAGAPRHVEAFAQRTGRRGVQGMDACRRVFMDLDTTYDRPPNVDTAACPIGGSLQ